MMVAVKESWRGHSDRDNVIINAPVLARYCNLTYCNGIR